MTTSKLARRGRPPKVTTLEDGTKQVTVKGTSFAFRNGRAVGPNRLVRGEDYDYAKRIAEGS